MKRILVFLMFLSTILYAQEEQQQESRNQLSLLIEGNSGTLVNNTDGYFAGNELTLAVEYKHSFVDWLSVFTRLGFISVFNFNNININVTGPDAKPGNEGVVNPHYQYNGFRSATVGVDYFETGLNFDDYGMVSVRARSGGETPTTANAGMLLKMYGYYPLVLGSIHFLKFIVGMEINPFPSGEKLNTGDPSLKTPGSRIGTYIDLLTVGTSYHIEFYPAWSFSSGLFVRTGGHRYKLANSATGNIWEADTAEAFRNNLYLRWDNTFSYNYNDSVVVWMQVRYQPERIAIAEQSDSIYELTTQHEVFLRFGMNYFFNF